MACDRERGEMGRARGEKAHKNHRRVILWTEPRWLGSSAETEARKRMPAEKLASGLPISFMAHFLACMQAAPFRMSRRAGIAKHRASTGQAQGKHRASTGQAQGKHRARRFEKNSLRAANRTPSFLLWIGSLQLGFPAQLLTVIVLRTLRLSAMSARLRLSDDARARRICAKKSEPLSARRIGGMSRAFPAHAYHTDGRAVGPPLEVPINAALPVLASSKSRLRSALWNRGSAAANSDQPQTACRSTSYHTELD
ncbi:hypothetical protein L1887_59225 [Cichorium endivia]|nr:hypothetical protein L1887_59225 [Cichorium endivia]